jgi:predicted RNase H-like nuclease (RuvC/YqgF family)
MKELTEILTFVISIITALGGYKAFELVFNKWANRKKKDLKNKQLENDISLEGQKKLFDFYKLEIEGFKEQLKAQQEQINNLQRKVEKLQEENEKLKEEINNSACYKYDCPNRKAVKC